MDSGEGVQSGKPALSTELPVSGEDLAGRHRPSFFLPIVFWGLFLAGLGLQFFAPHLHVAHDAFVIPQDAMGRGVAIDPVELIRHERQLQLISAMLVLAGAVGLGFITGVLYRGQSPGQGRVRAGKEFSQKEVSMMKIWHRAVVLLASLMVVATLTGIVGRAATAITTPNAAAVNYTLGAGGTSTTVTPASNQPVLILGSNNGTTDYGAGTVTLIHIPSTSLRWVGLEAGTGASTHNGSSALGTHIVWLDNNNKVDLQVYSADAFVIHNASTTSQSGTVKLIW